MKGNTFLQDDDEDLSVHHHCVQQASPHEQQAGQEVAVVAKAHTLAKEDAVVIPTQDAHLAVITMRAPWRSVRLTGVTVSDKWRKKGCFFK